MKRWSVLFLSLCLVLFSLGAAYASLDRDDSFLTINGTPLVIEAGNEGTLAVYVNGTRQYYNEDAWGSVLYLNYGVEGETAYGTPYFEGYSEYGVDAPFVPVSNDQVSSYDVHTTLDAGDSGVQLVQEVTYIDGERYYKKTWEITNNGDTTWTNLRFFHGGDTYFGGDDSSQGYYDSNLNMVYLTNPDPSIDGIMGFYAHPLTPADHYEEGGYYLVCQNIAGGQLADTVDSNDLDAGYGLQWNRDSLAPGQTWTIEAFEKWTEAGFVQVIAPAGESASAGTDLIYNFLVQNMDEDPASFDLAAQSSNGWTVSVDPSTVNISGGASELVDVTLSFPGDALHGTTDTLELTATSQADPGVTNSDSVTSTVDNGGDDDDDIVGDDDDDSGKVGDGSGCNVGTFSSGLLLLVAPLFFIKK